MFKSQRILASLAFVLLLLIGKLATPPQVQASILERLQSSISSLLSSPAPSPSPAAKQVLGGQAYNTETPRIYINGGDNVYSSGGLIMQATTDEPVVLIGGYRYPSSLEIKLYRAAIGDVMNYLVHDKDYAQKNRSLDTSGMTFVATVNVDMNNIPDYDSKRQPLPIEGKGIWYLEISGDKVKSSAIVLRSDHGIVTSEGDNELIYWAQKFGDLKSRGSGGTLKTFSLLDQVTELASTTYDQNGSASTPISEKVDIAISEYGDDLAIIPINLTYLNTGYGYGEFRTQNNKSRYFTFTDRPLYLPGDTIHFKSIIRDDSDAIYSIPTGNVAVTLTTDGNKKVKEMSLPISADGTVSGDIKLDKDSSTGWYSLQIQTAKDQNSNSYGEYTGVYDYSSASFNVEYYRKPETTLSIESNFADVIAGDSVSVDLVGSYFSGQPLIGQSLKYRVTSADYYEYNYLNDFELYSAELNDDYRYGYWYGSHEVSTGTISLDKTGRAKLDIPTSLSFNESGKSQVFTVEATLGDGSQDPSFTRKNILVRAGEFGIFATEYRWGSKVNTAVSLPIKTVGYHGAGKVEATDITASIVRRYWTKVSDPNQKYPRYEEGKEDLEEVKFRTSSDGTGTFTFTPSKSGSYSVILRARDKAGNNIAKEFNLYIADKDFPTYTPGINDENLSVTSNKKKYYPGDTADFTITSTIPDRDVFFAIERGHVRRSQIVHLTGKSAVVKIPLSGSDQPNVYADVSSFSTYRLDKAQLGISLDTSNKKMLIDIKTDKEIYNPGDTVTLNIGTTDATGAPVSAEVAVWAVDKAIFELTDSRLGNIFQTYWNERGNSTSYTHSLRGILVQTAERGGGGGGGDRTVFKDAAYWNPTARTGSDGRTTIKFKLPDNLTTWSIAAVGSSANTVVGQSTAEIKTSKELVIKPILPNLVRTGDELTVSAIARNFTTSDDTYDLSLEITGATVEDPLTSTVKIGALSSEQIYWRMTPNQDAKEISLKMAMTSKSDKDNWDSVSSIIPIKPFGFGEKTATFKVGSTTYDIDLPQDAQNPETKITLSLAPTLVTSLQSAMKYLLGYPYGCVEQLTSRLIPALLAKQNPSLFGQAMGDQDVDKYIVSGIKKISESHGTFDGWAWWSHGNPSSFVTSYVLEAMLDAKKVGYESETTESINAATNYLGHRFESVEQLSDEERAIRRYGLSLVNQANLIPAPSDYSKLHDDILAMAVMGSYRAGDHNSNTNGLSVLISRAQKEGNVVYWQAGTPERLGSRGASTAWAIRAIILAGGDRNLASAGVQYLLRNRTSDYWYNTYATSITSKAILELYGTGGESSPDFTYTIKLDNQLIGQGKINSTREVIKDLSIPTTTLKSDSKLVIETNGQGQLYSTLSKDLFRTDRTLKSAGQGLDIKREYINDKDPNYSIGLGDTVRVEFTVSGLTQTENYLVIEDQLPAGLVPVNESFKNEQFSLTSNYRDWSNKEYTDGGAVLMDYSVNAGTNVYSYKARVVSMGSFQAPPATATLMYMPEINGRTAVDTLKIYSESKLLPGKVAESVVKKYGTWQYITVGILAILAISLSIYFYRQKKNQTPPTDIPVTPETHVV